MLTWLYVSLIITSIALIASVILQSKGAGLGGLTGGDTGGIRLQVINFHTGFLVNTPEGAALRIRYLFKQTQKIQEMGLKGKEFVRENFLLTRQLREHLTLLVALQHRAVDRIGTVVGTERSTLPRGRIG